MSDSVETLFKWSNKLRSYPLCHSRPDRSFCYKGRYFGLCARCTSMYLTGFVTMLLFPIRSDLSTPISSVALGLLLITPTAIDGTTQLLGNRESTNLLRVITGILLGIGAVLFSEGVFFLVLSSWR